MPSLMNSGGELAKLTRLGKYRTKEENKRREHLSKHHTRIVRKVVGHDPLLLDWGSKVLQGTKTSSASTRNDLKAQVEVLCDFIYNVPAAAPFLLDDTLYQAIRWSQGVGGAESLDISAMSETTTATYFRGLLCAGLPSRKARLRLFNTLKTALAVQVKQVLGGTVEENNPGHASSHVLGMNTTSPLSESVITASFISARLGIPDHMETSDEWIHGQGREPLCTEICAFLFKYQFRPAIIEDEFLQQFVEDVTPAIALASILVASDEQEATRSSKSVSERAELAQCKPSKQLSGAWRVLAQVNVENMAIDSVCRLMVSIISASAALLCNTKVRARFEGFAGLEDGHFEACLDNLINLPGPLQQDHQGQVVSLVQGLYKLSSEENIFSNSLTKKLSDLAGLPSMEIDEIAGAQPANTGQGSGASRPEGGFLLKGLRRTRELVTPTQAKTPSSQV